ncbi:glycine--tRNA ligase subunit beta [Altererythrobacter confluentis]|uniref:Glycine--tRNA ligase beta subunit n=1 Tax=Allopontixanthobacter confluentis TaxID=1849021 RepID=A0A6L7GEL4_9SPHN|nr:glycine--tRNA ligase subunit beta [Allopontixanthobacter confluentis]MXP14050.1 glycine--tRNA ligase subunit beta [Allopontixanthobacter confluentis]
MTDFLLELRCEEIPARMHKGARADLEKLFHAQMDAAGVSLGEITVWSTPRRLALIARGLPQQTEAVSEEAKGPPEGAPDQAIDGFCRKNGVTRDQLELRDVKGRPTWFAVINKPGKAVRDVLADAIPAIIRSFPWPKSMRWGAASLSTESLRWVRPLSGIVAILGDQLVECEVDGVTSGYATMGHRFHHSGPITIGGADDYAEKLRACHVVVDHAEREAIIRSGAAKAAADAGLGLVEDEGLVVENAGLTEWPVPLLGRFEEDFLEVPPETIQLTARVNQKYFVCEQDGKLANAFICTANIDAADGGAAIVDGNRKVLAARLSDARFFWDVDRKKTLVEHAKGLERITFHEKLGTVADKVERVAKLAEWLASEGIVPNCDPALARQAAELCKADLVSEMVGEFPELQGLMGGYYARAEGLPDAVADAIRDHYKPVGQGDDVPTEPVTVTVSLADKLDTLVGFFQIDEKPTGSKDPFALRRASLGILRLILENGLRTSVRDLVNAAEQSGRPNVGEDVASFFLERLKVQQRDAGIRHDMIDAVASVETGGDNVRMVKRVAALQAFMATEDGTNLLAGYKRAANILKKEDWHGIEGEIAHTGEEDPLALVDNPDMKAVIAAKMAERRSSSLSYTPEPAEQALIEALDHAEPGAEAAIKAEDFAAAMAALASLRAPIDAFFDDVTVNDEDREKRASRLNLLDRFRNAVQRVADFSRIEG